MVHIFLKNNPWNWKFSFNLERKFISFTCVLAYYWYLDNIKDSTVASHCKRQGDTDWGVRSTESAVVKPDPFISCTVQVNTGFVPCPVQLDQPVSTWLKQVSVLQITLQTFYFTLNYFLIAYLNWFTYTYEE